MYYTYDNLSRVTARTVKKLSDNSVVSTETFNYDAAGNVTSAPDSSFQYDTNNRLISFNGNAIIYATAEDGSGVTASCPVSVKPSVQSISVSAERTTMKVGTTMTMSASWSPSDAIPPTIRWHSSNEAVATVGLTTGIVTAHSVGDVTITGITRDSGLVSEFDISVNMLIYRTREQERWGFVKSSDENDITPIIAEDLTYGGKNTYTICNNGTSISLSDLYVDSFTTQYTVDQRVSIIKQFFSDKVDNDPTFVSILHEMIDHFVSGSGNDYSNAALTSAVQANSKIQNYVNDVTKLIKNYIVANQGNIDSLFYDESLWVKPTQRKDHPLVSAMLKEIDNQENAGIENPTIYLPNHDGSSDATGLLLAIHTWHGNKIEIESFNIVEGDYFGTLRFTFYDHFGLDTNDLAHKKVFNLTAGLFPGFRQWYILQHWNELQASVQPKPFVTNVSFTVPFGGTLNT